MSKVDDAVHHSSIELDSTRDSKCAVADLLDRVLDTLNTSRRNCHAERDELMKRVESELHDLRTEAQRASGAHQQTQHELRALQEKLQTATLQRAASIRHAHTNGMDAAALQRVTKSSQLLQHDVRRAWSELELLKAAVFHEHLLAEERRRAGDAAEEALECRLQQTEAENAALRRALWKLRGQNERLAEVTQRMAENMSQWMPHLAQREAQLEETTAAFAAIQTEHTRLIGTVESLELSVEQYKAAHDRTLRQLEQTLTQLEARVAGEGERRQVGMQLIAPPPPTLAATTREAETGEVGATNRTLRKRLEHFYSIYNPSKLPSLGVIIDEYTGAEEELLAALEVHYGAFGFFSHY